MGCGVALGVAPAGEPALKTCRGTVVERTRQHILSLGGRVDSGVENVQVLLLKDTEDLPAQLDHVEQGEWSVTKRGMLIPGDLLTGSLWTEMCILLNQEDFSNEVSKVTQKNLFLYVFSWPKGPALVMLLTNLLTS